MLFHHSAISRTIDVLLSADEALHTFDVRFSHSGHLCNLKSPISLQLLRAGLVSHIQHRERIREKSFEQSSKECALSDSLRTIEHQHIVELDARMINSRDGRKEHLPDRFSVEDRILSAQIVHQELLNSFLAIPLRELLQIVLDRMESPLIGHRGQCHLEELLRKLHVVDISDPHIELLRVGILPEDEVSLPRKGIHIRLDHAGHRIHPDAFQVLIEEQDHKSILRIRCNGSILADLQLRAPVLVCFLRSFLIQLSGKLTDGILCPGISKSDLDGIVLLGKLHHGLIACLFVDWLLQISIGVQVPKLMDPHQIESIAELTACRICRVI